MIARAIDLVVNRSGARYRGLHLPCTIGKGGIGHKRGEGDGITPIGRWRIAEVQYRADRISPPAGWPPIPIGPADIWSDDPDDPAYNHGLRSRRHPFSHEAMFRGDPLYDLVGILDFNWPKARPGAGSAIFLHCWRSPHHPTAGCIAFAPPILRHILETWVPEARVVVGA